MIDLRGFAHIPEHTCAECKTDTEGAHFCSWPCFFKYVVGAERDALATLNALERAATAKRGES